MNSSRYIRQTLLSEVGVSGQQKLLAAKVTIVGCGGLGSVVAPYLAGAGVGRLTLIDYDTPHISNLHRQVFYHDRQQQSKAIHLQEHLQKLNPEIETIAIDQKLTKSNISALIIDTDLVVECTDDIYCKYLVNDYCHINRIPVVYGALHQYEGYVSVFENKNAESIHLRDIFAEPNGDVPTCSEIGVLSTAAGLIGMLQANEVLKKILQIGESLTGKLLTYNLLYNEQSTIKLRKTYTKSMPELYDQNIYQAVTCATTYQIDWDTVRANRTEYTVISILEDHEHQAIDEQVEHQPLSLMGDPSQTAEFKTVFYCKSGRRSDQLVQRILDRHPDASVYSLKGGIQGLDPTQ